MSTVDAKRQQDTTHSTISKVEAPVSITRSRAKSQIESVE